MKSGQPIMALFDLLGRIWGMGIIWNLTHGRCTFRELQLRCETVSPTTLNKRLKELTDAHLINRILEGYQLTAPGKELFELLHLVGKWSKKWAKEFDRNDNRLRKIKYGRIALRSSRSCIY